MDLQIRLHSDATAAIGIAKRRGLGKIRHLSTADLWIQEKIRNGNMELVKILGTENPADILTKICRQDLHGESAGQVEHEVQGGAISNGASHYGDVDK
jgi:hypothetical protein